MNYIIAFVRSLMSDENLVVWIGLY